MIGAGETGRVPQTLQETSDAAESQHAHLTKYKT